MRKIKTWRNLVRKVIGVDCSGDSKVLTELQIAIDRSYWFRRPKVKRIEKNSNDVFRCLFIRRCK